MPTAEDGSTVGSGFNAPPSRELARAVRKFVGGNVAKLDNIPASRLFRATVTTVMAAGASDGNAAVFVSWRGAAIPVNDYPDSYTPVEGHRVLCAVLDNQVSILHHGIGQP